MVHHIWKWRAKACPTLGQQGPWVPTPHVLHRRQKPCELHRSWAHSTAIASEGTSLGSHTSLPTSCCQDGNPVESATLSRATVRMTTANMYGRRRIRKSTNQRISFVFILQTPSGWHTTRTTQYWISSRTNHTARAPYCLAHEPCSLCGRLVEEKYSAKSGTEALAVLRCQQLSDQEPWFHDYFL